MPLETRGLGAAVRSTRTAITGIFCLRTPWRVFFFFGRPGGGQGGRKVMDHLAFFLRGLDQRPVSPAPAAEPRQHHAGGEESGAREQRAVPAEARPRRD